MSDKIEKYDGEKDLNLDTEVTVLPEADWRNGEKDLGQLESEDAKEVQDDLQVTGEDLADAEDYAKNLSLEDVTRILTKAMAVHEHDPNFSIDTINKAKMFLHDPEVIENPQAHSKLIHEMYVEAALMDNHSPYPEVRAVVSNKDDPTLPSSTVRVWVLGIGFVIVGAFINQLFDIRQPKIAVEANVAQLLIFPLGKAWAKWMPDKAVTIYGQRISLNPDRNFNQKEHMLATIMANTGFNTPYTSNIILTQFLPQYYNQSYAGSFAYQILITLGTNFVGYGMAGIIRRFLVNPTYAVWPTSLVTIALNKALHVGNDKSPVQGPFGKMFHASRMKCFLLAFGAMFIYFWFPNYIFLALSTFNWMSWIAPNNQVYNNVVGSVNGLGYNPVPTFDWNVLILNADPLVVPAFNIINATVGMFLTGFMVLGIYYSNSWLTGYLPINSNRTFDRFGKAYNILNITDSRGIFSQEKYEAYSPAYMSAGNITVYFWFFAAYAAVVSYAFLYHRREIAMGFKGIFKRGSRMAGHTDIHNRLMSVYPDVGEIWYFAILCFAILCGCLGVGLWETYTTPAVVIYGIILCAFCVIPVGIIRSITGLEVTMNVLAEFIGGSWVAGNALAMNYFKAFGYITTAQALSFSQDLKLGHYLKVPPRHTFCAQLVATLVSSFVCVGVFNFQMNQIEGICTPEAPFKMTCPGINTFFTASVFWGTLGPIRMFGSGGQYMLTLIGFPVGFCLPIIFYYAKKYFTKQTWLRQIHPVPLIFGGIYWAPYNFTYQWPALPISVFSMLYLKKRFLGFWSRYNYTVSAAFSTAIALSAVVIFFAVQLPEKDISWWGNEVIYEGCEGAACRALTIPDGGFGPGLGEFR